ncbi:outer membrane protein transport protein [uncultured Kordia sp.]|uniref:outer membrane protein transport protein n=1 Tax=uncultured Kordia sp. TaxID=507699 RepID=UPI00263130CC|nr:outer membrane protein transport protein [uncultured Kordia sp.]
MIRKFLGLSILLFICQVSIAQQGTASPYSFLGIGDLKFKGTTENRSMGGMSVYSDSLHLNLQNPAAFGSLKFTTYTLGASYGQLKLESPSGTDKGSSTALDYLAVGFPLSKKMGVGFGILPYSSVGYNFEGIGETGIASAPNKFAQYEGEGGLNSVFLSLGYKVSKSFSVGATVNYNFGNIKNQNTEFLGELNDDGSFVRTLNYGTRSKDESKLSGLSYNLGAYYQTKFNEKLSLTTSLTFSPQSNINSDNTRQLLALNLSGNGSEIVSSGQLDDIDLGDKKTTELKLPTKTSLGVGLGEKNKWFTGVEYTFLNSSNFGNSLTTIENVTYENSSKIAVGGFYIPKFNSFTSYWERVTYRAGIRYEHTGIAIRNENLNDFGISFGVGLPVGRTISNLNLGVEFGQRGTTNAGLIKENYVNFHLSLSLNDVWFIKRKYN